jgi:prepilin peptidase CpaA
MGFFSFTSLFMIITLVVVSIATYTDTRWRIIPNSLTIPAIIIGFGLHTLHSGWAGFTLSLVGLTFGALLFLLFFLVGGMGAGDVKLMGAIGALTGPVIAVSATLLTFLIGGLVATGKMILDRSARSSRETALPPDACSVRGHLISRQKKAGTNTSNTIPYGPIIAVGTVITLLFSVSL